MIVDFKTGRVRQDVADRQVETYRRAFEGQTVVHSAPTRAAAHELYRRAFGLDFARLETPRQKAAREALEKLRADVPALVLPWHRRYFPNASHPGLAARVLEAMRQEARIRVLQGIVRDSIDRRAVHHPDVDLTTGASS